MGIWCGLDGESGCWAVAFGFGDYRVRIAVVELGVNSGTLGVYRCSLS